MKSKLLLFTAFLALASCKNDKNGDAQIDDSKKMAMQSKIEPESPDFDIMPIEHATAVFTIDSTVFYIDPVGGAEAFNGKPEPQVILVTDIHGDHLNAETIKAVATADTKIIVPQAVADEMGETMKEQLIVLDNGETTEITDISITGIPMYNLREEAKDFHVKGRGNGYVLEKGELKIYFSGDTEDIPEMRNLEDIDYAFVCMNLPYTMPVDRAAEGVLAFAPDRVYPYHYRGQDGLSDIEKFKNLVNEGEKDVKVVELNWYPNREE